jgi:hypothetical protein
MIRERFQPDMSKDTLISIIDDDALARDGIGELVESLVQRHHVHIGGAFSPI